MNYETKYDFYLAGPFFNDLQLDMQEKIEQLMQLNGKSFFSPRLHAGSLGDSPTMKRMREVFNNDINAINNCKYLFANISFRDTGTAVEIGYALSRNIPIILFWNENVHDSKNVNLMLVCACNGKYIKDWIQLSEYLTTNELPNNDLGFEVE